MKKEEIVELNISVDSKEGTILFYIEEIDGKLFVKSDDIGTYVEIRNNSSKKSIELICNNEVNELLDWNALYE